MTRVRRILGVSEEELVRQSPEERQQYICRQVGDNGEKKLHFVNAQTGNLTPIGDFSTPTIAELKQQVEAMATNTTTATTATIREEEKKADETTPLCRFHCLYRVDIGELQTRLKTSDQCLVQVAGNFNCLNGPNRTRAPNSGRLVEFAFQQKTQGPAATFGPLACNLYRSHFALSPEYSGQTLDHQINMLQHVADYTGVPINGKLTLTGNERPVPANDEEMDEIVGQVQVGLQTNCHVLYGRNKQGREVYLVQKNDTDFTNCPVIDQCHGAAVNWKSLTADSDASNTPPAWTQTPEKQREIYTLSRMILRAAYEGIYLAALTRRTTLC